MSLTVPIARDVETLIGDVRQADREEWVMGTRRPLDRALPDALAYGDNWALVDEHSLKCLAMFGVQPLKGTPDGIAWMIATNEAARRARRLLPFFEDGMGLMHAKYPTMWAFASHLNVTHHVWMRRYGWAKVDDHTGPLGFRWFLFKRSAAECAHQPHLPLPRLP